MENKRSLSGLASFIALAIAAILFVVEYAVGVNGAGWARYLLIAKDVAIAISVIFASMAYAKHSGILVKVLFFLIIATYIVFAVLTQVYQ